MRKTTDNSKEDTNLLMLFPSNSSAGVEVFGPLLKSLLLRPPTELLIKLEPSFQLIGQTMIDKPSNFPKTWTQGPDYWPARPPITAIAADTDSPKSNNNN